MLFCIDRDKWGREELERLRVVKMRTLASIMTELGHSKVSSDYLKSKIGFLTISNTCLKMRPLFHQQKYVTSFLFVATRNHVFIKFKFRVAFLLEGVRRALLRRGIPRTVVRT